VPCAGIRPELIVWNNRNAFENKNRFRKTPAGGSPRTPVNILRGCNLVQNFFVTVGLPYASLRAIMADEGNQPWKKVGGKRGKVISYVKSPLGFYTLALLIVESFLLGSGRMFGLSETVRIAAMVAGVFLFLVVVGIVTTLVIKYPQFLVFTEQSHLEWEYMHVSGDNSRPLSGKTIIVAPGTEPPDKPQQPTDVGGSK
jgi:hypothetical protein